MLRGGRNTFIIGHTVFETSLDFNFLLLDDTSVAPERRFFLIEGWREVKICQVRETELEAIERLYAATVDSMRGTPYDILWEMGLHPSHDALLAASRAGELYAAWDEGPEHASSEPFGAFILNGSQAPGYRQGCWNVDVPDDQVAVIHLLTVHPDARGRGVGKALVFAAIEESRARGKCSLRLDVFDNNAPARAMYERCGFTDLGVFTLDVGDGFVHAANLMEFDLRESAADGEKR